MGKVDLRIGRAGAPRITSLGLLVASALVPRTAHAWIFIEHTSIGREAMTQLGKPDRDTLAVAWKALLETGNLGKDVMCTGVAEPDTPVEQPRSATEKPFATCVDLPMLAALAGDHSCSTADLTATIRSTWIKPLVKAFWENYSEIRETHLESPARVSLWHEENLEAQRLDDAYLSRASGTGAHFVLPRTAPHGLGEDAKTYMERVSNTGAPVSSVGNYISYHARALRAAAGASCTAAGQCAAADQARDALLYEAVALHFLEDSFASGHVVGVPADGSSSGRLGTHDHYCQDGLSVVTWSDQAYSAYGDAHLRPLDKCMVSNAVRSSLAQLAGALRGDGAVAQCAGADEPLDVCSTKEIRPVVSSCVDAMSSTLDLLPAPPIDETMDPSFRNDIGVFVRFGMDSFAGAGVTSAAAAPAYSSPQGVPTWGLDVGIGLGFSAAGVTTSSSDAEAYFQVGIGAESGQRSMWCLDCPSASQQPDESRIGFDFRVRLPYWVVPGDFIVFGPLAAAGWKWAFNRVVQSAEGGIYWRWQRVHDLGRVASWQIVLGREVEYTLFSLTRALDEPNPTNTFARSFAIGGPLVDFTLTHSFSEVLSGHVRASLGYRYEHSELVSGGNFVVGHFAVLSIASDSNLYFSGL